MIRTLLELPRKTKQTLILSFDVIAVIGCLFASFSIRLGYFYYPTGDNNLLLIIFAAPLLALPIFIRFGLYHTVIRYVGFRALWRINQAATLYSILWGLIGLMFAFYDIPRSVILINWLLVMIVVGGSRLFIRWLLSVSNLDNHFLIKNSVLIYGAGSAGRQLSTALNESREYKPVAFIDDANELYRHYINGLEVFSQDDLEDLIKKENIKEVLLAMPALSRVRRKEIINFLEPYPVVVRSLPSVSELAQGKVKVNDLLEIDK